MTTRGAGALDKRVADVGCRDVLGIEREDPLLERARRATRFAASRAPLQRALPLQRDRRKAGTAAHAARTKGNRDRGGPAQGVDEFAHVNESMLCSMDAITASTSARVSAAVRNVMPILTAAPDVVTATTIGDIGPVDAAAQVIAIAGLAASAQRVDVERREPRENRMILEVQPLPPLGLCERPDQRGCAHRHQRHQIELEPLRAPGLCGQRPSKRLDRLVARQRVHDAERAQELAEDLAGRRLEIGADVDDRREGDLGPASRVVAPRSDRHDGPQHEREQQVVLRDAPSLRRLANARDPRGIDAEVSEAVVAVRRIGNMRADRVAPAGEQAGQRCEAARQLARVLHEQPRVRRRVTLELAWQRRVRRGITVRDVRDQHGDRVAAGDEVIVGQARAGTCRSPGWRRNGTDRSARCAGTAALIVASICDAARSSGDAPPSRTCSATAAGPPSNSKRRRSASRCRPVSPQASSTLAIAARSRVSSSGASIAITCEAQYGCSSRQRSIDDWNRLSRPRISE